jgi:phosphoglucomutase
MSIHALAGKPASPDRLVDVDRNGAAIGGIKATTAYGWFAARPSGAENVYKLYAESFRAQGHLRRIQEDAQALVRRALTTVAY